jgi:Tfp pilus assembly protein PilF
VSWNNLGVLALGAGDVAEADSLFRRAIALDAHYSVALFNLGNLHFRRNEDEEAETLFRRAIAADSSNAAAYNQLGVLLLEEARLDEAVATLDRGLSAGDARVEPFLLKNRGKVAAARGYDDEARAYWERALQEAPNDAELQLLLERGD